MDQWIPAFAGMTVLDAKMSTKEFLVGGSLEEDAAAFLDAWHRAERGEDVDENVLAFESREALSVFIKTRPLRSHLNKR